MAFINAVKCQCKRLEARILKLELFIGEAYEMFCVPLDERRRAIRPKKTNKREKWKQTTLYGKILQPIDEPLIDNFFEPTTTLELQHIETLKNCRQKYLDR